jgi:hypothetical protein
MGKQERSVRVHLTDGKNKAAVDSAGHQQVDVIAMPQDLTYSTVALPALNTTLATNTSFYTSVTSARNDVSGARKFALGGTVDITGAPTDLRFVAQFAATLTSQALPYQRDFWVDLRFEDTMVSGGYSFCLDGEVEAPYLEFLMTMTGGVGTSFTCTNMMLFLKD